MKQTRYTTDQIFVKLRQSDIELGKGEKVPEVCKIPGINTQTCCRWRQKYGGLEPSMISMLRSWFGIQGEKTPHPSLARDPLRW